MSPVFYENLYDVTEPFFAGDICDHPYPTHVHDMIEIVCVKSGEAILSVSGNRYTVLAGDMLVVFPSFSHSYDYVSEDISGVTLFFQPDTIAQFSHPFRSAAPLSPVLPKSKISPELNMMIDSLAHIYNKGNNMIRTGYLHLFLSYLFSCLELTVLEKAMHSSISAQALHYIAEHFMEPLSLESTARALGISRIHLSHVFSQQLKINFRQHINSLRIDHACSLLHDPSYSVGQISDMCGYSNPRTFHRAFLAQCGVSPNQFRANIISE